MMTDLLNDQEFIKLEKEFKFLSRARDALKGKHGEIEKLNYIIFDIETTGLSPATDEIIEIGAMKCEGPEVKDVFNRLVKPERPVSQHITDLTGITNEMLEHELPLKPVLDKFLEFIGDSILIAHNADFDTTFIKNAVQKAYNRSISNPIICTLHISRNLLPNLDNHKLHTIANYYHLNVVNRHRAMGDVELTFQIWTKFLDKLKEKNIMGRIDLEKYMKELYDKVQARQT